MDLKGKKIAFLGDSITEGHGVADLSDRYDNRLGRMCGLGRVSNHGIGGTRIAYQRCPSESPKWDLYFCGRAMRLEPDSDIIVVFGGTNDYGHGDAPFGEPGDRTPATFRGAVYWLMEALRTLYPDAVKVFLLPARRVGDTLPSREPGKPAGMPVLAEYNAVIRGTAEGFGYPVLDLYNELGIDPNDGAQRKKYAPDGLHFNGEGHGVIARKLKEFLEAL